MYVQTGENSTASEKLRALQRSAVYWVVVGIVEMKIKCRRQSALH